VNGKFLKIFTPWMFGPAAVILVASVFAASKEAGVGREVAVSRHFRDGEEFGIPLRELLNYGGVYERIVDQLGADFLTDGILISESVTVGPNGLNLPSNPTTGSEATYNGGTFDDRFFFCSAVCGSGHTGETDATQVLFYSGVPVLSPNTIALRCTSITWNGQ
jgi:hypothetical protein